MGTAQGVHHQGSQLLRLTPPAHAGTRAGVRFLSRGVAGQDAALLVVSAACMDTVGGRAVGDSDEGLLHEHA